MPTTTTTTSPTDSQEPEPMVGMPLSHAMRYQRLMELGAERLLQELEQRAGQRQDAPTFQSRPRQPLGFSSAKAWTPPTSEYAS